MRNLVAALLSLLTFAMSQAAGVYFASCPELKWSPEAPSATISTQSAEDHVRVRGVLHPPTAKFLSDAGIHWPIGVGSVVDPFGNHIATAALVSESHLLTVAHALSSTESLRQRYFVLGNALVPSNTPNAPPTAQPDSGFRCFRLTTNTISSFRGYLDYAVIELGRQDAANIPPEPAVNIFPVSSVELAQGDTAHLVGLYEPPTPIADTLHVPGLTLLSAGSVGGHFSHVGRYTKDAGTAIQVDYWLETQKGHSGSPLLDGKGRWVAMHQRNLNSAKCETNTPWHPYISDYYFDHFGGVDGDSRLESACSDMIEPDLALLRDRKISLPNGSNLPRQGSLLVDIAMNIERKVGAEWLCENIPQFLALLHRRRLNSTECMSGEFKKALDRMRSE